MKLTELPDTLAEKVGCLIQPIVQPNHAGDNRNESQGADLQSRWQPKLAQMAAWKSNPDQVADEGVLAPPVGLVASAEDVR